MTRTMLTAILLMSAQLPCAAQEKPADDAIDPREAIRCGTFYLLASDKHKGEEISRVYQLAARSLLEPTLARVGEKKTAEWTDEFLAEFLKVPKEGGQFDEYLKDLIHRCDPLAMRAAREISGKPQTPDPAEKPKQE